MTLPVKENNVIKALIFTEKGCDPKDGEYSLFISQFVGLFGEDDYGLVDEAIVDCMDDLTLPEEGWTEVTLIETGESENGAWHKYYEISCHENH